MRGRASGSTAKPTFQPLILPGWLGTRRSVQSQTLLAAVDSEPLPVCTFKLHAWCALNGEIVAYSIRPANEHDYNVFCQMNGKWPAYGGPQQIGDKGYQSITTITPPKVNAKRPNPRWREEFIDNVLSLQHFVPYAQ